MKNDLSKAESANAIGIRSWYWLSKENLNDVKALLLYLNSKEKSDFDNFIEQSLIKIKKEPIKKESDKGEKVKKEILK